MSLWEGCWGGALVEVHMLFSSLSNWLGNQWLRDTRVAVSCRADPKPCSLSSYFAAAPRQIWGFFVLFFLTKFIRFAPDHLGVQPAEASAE